MLHQRSFYTQKIEKAFHLLPIVVLIGARQVGKTSLMNMYVPAGTKVFLNGQDVEIAELFSKFSVIEQYLQIKLNTELEGYLFIDEFQFINGVATMLKLLTDKYPLLKILCSGSSSLDILQKVEESLAGRVRIIEVFSLSFVEYMQFTNSEMHELFMKYDINTPDEVVDKRILPLLNEYLVYGGFPRVALTPNNDEKIELLDDIYKTYLLRDVRNYARNQDTVGFNRLLKLLSAKIGNLININELSVNSGLPYKKCEEYIYLLEQMYIIKQVEPFSTNKRKTITKMKKLFFTDLGLRNIIYNSFSGMEIRIDNGAIFENYVFLELQKIINKAVNLNFYRTTDGSEIDFIINNFDEIIPIVVKYKKFDKFVSLKNLKAFQEVEQFSRSYIINQNFNEQKEKEQFLPGYFLSELIFDYPNP